MVQRKGMLGLERLSRERVGISKYSTERLASRSSLCDARRAIPTSGISLFSLFIRLIATGIQAHFTTYFHRLALANAYMRLFLTKMQLGLEAEPVGAYDSNRNRVLS